MGGHDPIGFPSRLNKPAAVAIQRMPSSLGWPATGNGDALKGFASIGATKFVFISPSSFW
jgi:hypothetical protein